MDQLWQAYYWLQFALGAIALGTAIYMVASLCINMVAIRKLLDVPMPERSDWPKISLIAPARNEERNIEGAMRSLLAIAYPNLQITIVNDRSTDRTGEILNRLAAEDSRLNVVTIDHLPPGWLGKNHAMHVGARLSDGDWLLFTDADVVFEPTTLSRAIGYAEQHRLDHLAAYPDARMGHPLLNAMVVTFAMMFTVFIRPWQVRNPKRKAYIGIGAFNLVRRSAYVDAGGHVPIRMRPDDDLKLGHLLKKSGGRCDVVSGLGCVIVEWYASVWEMIVGLEKNGAAPMEYNVPKILAACGMLILANVWPFVAVFITWGWAQALFAGAIVCLLASVGLMTFSLRQPLWSIVLFPVAITLFAYIQLRGLALLLARGGIRWRDTFYPLADLKANRI